ncbi:MAG: outer membrane beta-barrel protein [Gemmatimonadetes bacterium]|nr:outer membrane beta-barrel protein [Gemmatimonadota bacterium]
MRRIALLAVLALALPVAVDAQARLMVGGGLSTPNGDFSGAVDAGLHGRVGLQVGVPVFPVNIRAEGEVHRFPEVTGGAKTNMIAGTVSAVMSLGGIGLSPYVLAGFGRYRVDPSATAAETNKGFHGGFGVSLGALGLGGYAEIRVVNVSGATGDTRYIPVTVGLRF